MNSIKQTTPISSKKIHLTLKANKKLDKAFEDIHNI